MLDPQTLLAPQGPITPKLFPREGTAKLGVRLERYVETAYNHPKIVAMAPGDTRDRAARAYALHLAFKDVYIRMTAEPATLKQGEAGSHSYLKEQIANMATLAADYLAEFEGLIPSAVTTTRNRPTSARQYLTW